MQRPALRQSDLFSEASYESGTWSDRLLAAFADTDLQSGFLPLAEQAVGACPGDPVTLMLAATAALLDEQPQRALVFLKRFSKHASAPAEHLLHALALNQINQRVAARALLERNGLTTRLAAAHAFPGQFEQNRSREHHAARAIQIVAHTVGVDEHAANDPRETPEHVVKDDETVGQNHALDR